MTLLRVVDIETTGEVPPEHKIIEIASLDLVDGWSDGGRVYLVNPGRPIPPAASAVHHILDEDVAGEPTIELLVDKALHCLARNAEEPPRAFVAHFSKFELQWLAECSRGVPWICTGKCAMRAWPSAPAFGNQVLRYWLGFGRMGDHAFPPHRALPDCVVTAAILQRLLAEVSLEQLIAWSAEPAHWPRCPLRKHRGQPWAVVPADYLDWILREPEMDVDLKWCAQHELDRRAADRCEQYTIKACLEPARCGSVEMLEHQYSIGARDRLRHAITKDTPHYQRIVQAYADRKAALLAPVPLPAGVPTPEEVF